MFCTLSCIDPAEYKLEVTLQFPDKAYDQFGNVGFWTLIYNQVIFITVNDFKTFSLPTILITLALVLE